MENLTLLIGVLVGVATAVILVLIIFCVSRPWANYYRQDKYSDKQQGNSYIGSGQLSSLHSVWLCLGTVSPQDNPKKYLDRIQIGESRRENAVNFSSHLQFTKDSDYHYPCDGELAAKVPSILPLIKKQIPEIF